MLKDLPTMKQSQLANTLMKTILTYLTPKDFNIFPNPNSYTYDKDFYSSSQSTYPMTKMGTPSKDLLFKFYNKCNQEYKKVLEGIEEAKELVNDPELGEMAHDELKELETKKDQMELHLTGIFAAGDRHVCGNARPWL